MSPLDLLPKDKDMYTYQGSLTTPPCNEVVQWLIFRQTVSLPEKTVSYS